MGGRSGRAPDSLGSTVFLDPPAPVPGLRRVLLVRHGQSEWNAAGRWQGWADTPLTALGERQAQEAGTRIATEGSEDRLHFVMVIASDLSRATRTAEVLSLALGLDPAALRLEARVREYDVGDWCGLTRPEIEEGWPGDLARWRDGSLPQTPGGETREAFVARILAGIRSAASGATEIGDDVVLLVAHGGVIGAVQRELGHDGNRDRIGNLGGRWLTVDRTGALTLGALVALLEPDGATLSPTL